MIIKTKTFADPSGGWLWIDGVKKVSEYGFVFALDDPPSQSDDAYRSLDYFTNLSDLAKAVDYMWGDQREFDSEVWPDILPGQAISVKAFVADRNNNEQILLLIAHETFLMSDTGATVDRLR